MAEGTPEALKREVGRKRIEVVPAHPADRLRTAAALARFGEPYEGRPEAVSIAMPPGQNGVEEVVRALDHAGVTVADLALHAPTLDDVFLDKTGRTLEGAADRTEVAA